MRIACILLGLVLGAAPAMAQKEPPKEAPKDPPKEAPKDPPKEEPKDEKKREEPPKREMTPEGKKLFEDAELVYSKYYAIVLEKTKSNESYKATDVWDTAVKEARHAKYKDNAEWSVAINAMKRKDKVFAKELADLITRKAEEFKKALQ